MKEALIEVIEEKKEVVYDLIVEVMEDIAMIRSVQDGENSGHRLVLFQRAAELVF